MGDTKEIVPAAPTPLEMLADAVARGTAIETVERLMGLSERWQAGEAKKAYAAALARCRADLPAIVKTQQVSYGQGKTQYRYEDLAEVVEAVSPVMAGHGLSFRWRTDSTTPGYVAVTCILEHEQGHSEETTLSGPYDTSGNKNAIQAIGSVVTYLQRYTLKCALGVAAARDDDGRQGAANGEPPRGSATPEPPKNANAAPPRPAKPKPAPKAVPATPPPTEQDWLDVWDCCERLAELMEGKYSVDDLKGFAAKKFEAGEPVNKIKQDIGRQIAAYEKSKGEGEQ